MYTLTERQLDNLTRHPFTMPTDDEIKIRAKREHKLWSILKRNLTLDALKVNPEYVRGIWQGRLDRAMRLDYAEERLESAYNLGYYRGYKDFERDSRGGQLAAVLAAYLS
jgi:hypothetical protein